MKTIQINKMTLEKGKTKICIPITGKTDKEIQKQAEEIAASSADLAEWRADCFEDFHDLQKLLPLGKTLQATLKDKPLLFTFRTAAEGGESAISPEEYQNLYTAVIDSGFAPLLDVEAALDDTVTNELLAYAHKHKKYVIASNHDFKKTPPKDEILRRLCHMQDMGADISKIAVMPNSKKDVLLLLEAGLEMSEQLADRPFITISMGTYGRISRILGEFTGSALTFASLGHSSAPGQWELEDLKTAQDLLASNPC